MKEEQVGTLMVQLEVGVYQGIPLVEVFGGKCN
jgi:hypothetical protein